MKLSYGDEGTGPAVVLLHGFPLDRTMWDAQVRALSPGYRVIAPDLRGHGRSPAPDGAYTMDQMAEDVVELLDGLEIQGPVVLGGLSMGGYVSLALALNHPERVRALVLTDTRALADSPEAAAAREQTARAVLKAGGLDDVIEGMVARLFARSTFHDRPALVPPIQDVMERTSPMGVAGALRGMALRPDRRPRLKEITCPTLVVVGDCDVISPLDEMKALADAMPGARFQVIRGAGHLSPYESPDAFNSALLEFLKDLPPHD